MTYQSVNPFDNKLVRSFDDITDAQLEAKIATAAACYEIWKRTSYADRALIMARAAKLLHEQAERFARIMTLEMGKRIGEARGEVSSAPRSSPTTPRTPSVSSHPSRCIRRRGKRIWRAVRSA